MPRPDPIKEFDRNYTDFQPDQLLGPISRITTSNWNQQKPDITPVNNTQNQQS